MSKGYFDKVKGIRTQDDAVPKAPGQMANLPEGNFQAVIGSPPFQEKLASLKFDEAFWKKREEMHGSRCASPRRKEVDKSDYGNTEGQLSNLPEGDFGAVIGSPPYAEVAKAGKGIGERNDKTAQILKARRPKSAHRNAMALGYSANPDQLSNLPQGDFSAVVSSPNYEQGCRQQGNDRHPEKIQGGKRGVVIKGEFAAAVSSPPYEAAGWRADENPENPIRRAKERAKHFDRPEIEPGRYGSTPNNLGNSAGETYWSACAEIYRNCFLLLKPGGFIALVVKSFVRKKKIVDLPSMTWELLQVVGFEPVERNRAWLVEEREAATFFEANYSVKRERKSFFRRLAEKKGSPKIDFEEVLICKKP